MNNDMMMLLGEIEMKDHAKLAEMINQHGSQKLSDLGREIRALLDDIDRELQQNNHLTLLTLKKARKLQQDFPDLKHSEVLEAVIQTDFYLQQRLLNDNNSLAVEGLKVLLSSLETAIKTTSSYY